MSVRPALCAVGLVSLLGTARADVRGEVGFAVGGHIFSTENALGTPDGPNATSQQNSILMALRLGVYIQQWVGIEGELGAIPSRVRAEDHSTMNVFYRGNAVLQFRATNPDHVLIPFVLGGYGWTSLVAKPGVTLLDKDTVGNWQFGGGIKLRDSESGLGLRADARVLLPPSSQSDSFTEDFELSVSVYGEFGGPKKKQAPIETPVTVVEDTKPPEAKPVDEDPDKDGISGTDDKCPQVAEDKDNFQDTDGCPESDNDFDGVADTYDKCPTDPETKNGFEDTDGCPDELPAAVKQFSGKVEGISFKTGSADLLATSNKTLDQVVSVLKEYPDLKIEVGGHTDDAPLNASKNAKFKSNDELSQARADAVRAYLLAHGVAEGRITAKGYGSSVPVENPAGLTGSKLSEVRAKNRRVEFKIQ